MFEHTIAITDVDALRLRVLLAELAPDAGPDQDCSDTWTSSIHLRLPSGDASHAFGAMRRAP